MSARGFPDDFVWGAASSAYQIEGAPAADGKGESIWDGFVRLPGKIRDGSSGEVACDHYRRFGEDVRLMKELGLRGYRFSVSWPRVLPDGTGAINARGLDFYSRLVDALLEANVEPWLTLYHWDLPIALQERGGWASRDVAGWFSDYASLVARTLGDRVRRFITLNEPQIFCVFGHLTGEHAPGLVDVPAYFAASHHVHLAHGLAVRAVRAAAPSARIGIAEQIFACHPATDSEADRAAARRVDGVFNRWYLDPLLRGSYPEDVLSLFSFLPSPVRDGDLDVVGAPLDFVGINNYTRQLVRHDPNVPLFEVSVDGRRPGAEYTEMGWEVCPEAFGEVLACLRTEYGNPTVVVTENGAAMPETIDGDGVHDPRRIDYLRRYLEELGRQIAAGSSVAGYFVWSLTDNFEWAHGLEKRFGLVRVDYDTQKRTPKDAAAWYAAWIAEHSARG
ncbi:MAG TPA: GH1 family beta-glucosidase [Polyangiaceae bacterium]|nr:GH1 family beta-glucosidase [Polyangiaceae bacterium]